MRKLVSAVVLVGMAACTAEREPEVTGAANQDLPADAAAINPRPNSPAPEPAGYPLASGTFSGTELLVPAALNRGRFRRNGECLEVVVAGETFTPILSGSPRDLGPSFSISNDSFKYGEWYRLGGGPVVASDDGITVSEEVREKCVPNYYAIVEIGRMASP